MRRSVRACVDCTRDRRFIGSHISVARDHGYGCSLGLKPPRLDAASDRSRLSDDVVPKDGGQGWRVGMSDMNGGGSMSLSSIMLSMYPIYRSEMMSVEDIEILCTFARLVELAVGGGPIAR